MKGITKNILKRLSSLKLFAGIVFIGMIIFYTLGKAIFYKSFEIQTIKLVWLVVMAIAVTVIQMVADWKESKKLINNFILKIGLGILIVGLMYLSNWLFGLFEISGIQYLYFGLIMAGLYTGGLFGFWVVEKMEVDVLNISLQKFKSQK